MWAKLHGVKLPFRATNREGLLQGLPREVGILAAIAFCVALGFGILAPAIPVFARQFGVSAFLAGAVVSAFAFVRLLSAAPAGGLVNKLGERKVLATGLAIVAISSAAAAFSGSYAALLVMRGLGGVGSAMFTVSAMALLLRTVGSDHRGRAVGAYHSGFLIGGIAGPAVGGLVVGISIRAPFLVYAVTLAAATFVCLVWLRDPNKAPESDAETNPQPPTGDASQQPAVPLRTVLRLRAYWAALLVNLGSGFNFFGVRSALVPLFVVEGLRQGPGVAAGAFLLSAVAQGLLLLPAGRLADNRGRRPALIIGGIGSLIGSALLVVSSTTWIFLLAMVVLGAAGAYISAAPAAIVGDITHGQRAGSPIAVFQMISDVGAIIGPLAAGWVLDQAGFPPAFTIGVVIVGIGLAASFAMPETLRKTTKP